ncbi:MAG: hypothetical protein V4606_02485 [Patescibacteria group bacterium]
MKPTIPAPVSRRLRELGDRIKTCPVCKRQDVEVEGPNNGEWVIKGHSPHAGGFPGCTGTNKRIPLTAKEKASP